MPSWLRAGLASLLLLSGCAAWTNPVADGIPAIDAPPGLLAVPKDKMETLPLSYLRQKTTNVYRVAGGDILGIYVSGVLGEPNQAPPVNVVEDLDLSPSLGFPVPVDEDGTLTLPLIEPLTVGGMTVKEIRQAIIQAYTTGPEPIVKPGRERVIATLVRPRQVRVLVMRQDSPAGGISLRRPGFVRSTREFRGGAERLIRGTSSGSGTIVSLPAYQNDVLTALALSGGLPGLDAANEILILRGYPGNGGGCGVVEPYLKGDMVVIPDGPASPDLARQITRIPLRWWPGEPPPFRPEEIILNQGDIVYIKARDTDVFYTGGLLPSGEYPLPRDHDLTVTEAVAQVGGPLINGGINSNNLSGAIVARGIGSPSPRLVTVVRKTQDGCQVPITVDLFCALNDPHEDIVIMPGDLLVMQETRHQALARYITDVFSFSFIADVISRSDATGTIITTVP